MRRILPAVLTLFALAIPAAGFAAEGLAGATVGATAGDNGNDRRARLQEWCRSEPAKCDELRTRRAERRARFEAWCKDNREKCQAIRARREQCRANPEQCRAERQARFDERFRKADSDGDGALSRVEAEKGMRRLARHFEAIDTDKDSRVTREEIEAARKARAARRHKSRES